MVNHKNCLEFEFLHIKEIHPEQDQLYTVTRIYIVYHNYMNIFQIPSPGENRH